MSRRQESPPSVEELYGLDPVIEPGEDPSPCSASLQSRSVQCPYCGEAFDTVVDPSSGSARYIEDCQVCCQPIEFTLDVQDNGRLAALEARRSD
ncbi:MAG: CPXCG motif-containing cysteine-rich protein [Proteobacteria bacterium]|nr:CPXCG motif-containing cysteine-rich protein [Pseudomonadota bacterium]